MIKSIPLSKLVQSPRNVRRSSDESADLQLKADIEARGLLQNLVVSAVKKPRGCYAVEAGGRRLRALKALVEEGKLNSSHEVCCLVLARAEAHEAGLAENFQRLNMNPADECLAFRQLIDEGADIEGIARRFGLTTRFVEGRLRLAGLAPVVFEALGAGEISLDVAKAYAASSDQERQAYVFGEMSRYYGGSHPDTIRRMMTQAAASPTDRRARFVGADAYVAAGGRIERDLFSDETGEHWLDIALLERLAGEKLEAAAAQMAADMGLAWVRPTLGAWIDGSLVAGLTRIVPERPPVSAEEQARIDALEAEIGELVGSLEDEETDDEARAAAEARIAAIDAEIDLIADKPPIIDEALKFGLGAFLLLDAEGRPKLDAFFYAEAPVAEGQETGSEASPGAGAVAPLVIPAAAEEKTPKLSQALIDELAIQRRDILAVHVARNPALALDLATFLMVDREAGYSSGKSGSSLSALPPSDPVFGFKTPEAKATIARAESSDSLDRSWTSGASRADRFDAFRALPNDARTAWLAHAVARTLEASNNLPAGRPCAFHDHLGQLLGIDVASWWRPTGANYFDRVPKGVTLAALEDVGGPAFAARFAKSKKAELSHSAERIFAGDFIAEVEMKERALAWVPEAMRFAAPAAAAPAEETPPWEEAPAADGPAEARESGGSADEEGGGEPSETIEEAA